jgi:hypothetical protein
LARRATYPRVRRIGLFTLRAKKSWRVSWEHRWCLFRILPVLRFVMVFAEASATLADDVTVGAQMTCAILICLAPYYEVSPVGHSGFFWAGPRRGLTGLLGIVISLIGRYCVRVDALSIFILRGGDR